MTLNPTRNELASMVAALENQFNDRNIHVGMSVVLNDPQSAFHGTTGKVVNVANGEMVIALEGYHNPFVYPLNYAGIDPVNA